MRPAFLKTKRLNMKFSESFQFAESFFLPPPTKIPHFPLNKKLSKIISILQSE